MEYYSSCIHGCFALIHLVVIFSTKGVFQKWNMSRETICYFRLSMNSTQHMNQGQALAVFGKKENQPQKRLGARWLDSPSPWTLSSLQLNSLTCRRFAENHEDKVETCKKRLSDFRLSNTEQWTGWYNHPSLKLPKKRQPYDALLCCGNMLQNA